MVVSSWFGSLASDLKLEPGCHTSPVEGLLGQSHLSSLGQLGVMCASQSADLKAVQ